MFYDHRRVLYCGYVLYCGARIIYGQFFDLSWKKFENVTLTIDSSCGCEWANCFSCGRPRVFDRYSYCVKSDILNPGCIPIIFKRVIQNYYLPVIILLQCKNYTWTTIPFTIPCRISAVESIFVLFFEIAIAHVRCKIVGSDNNSKCKNNTRWGSVVLINITN